MKPLGVGVIGLGRIAPRHIADSIKQLKELKLVAVCDIKPLLAKAVGEKEKVKYFTHYQDLIKDKEVDVVSVCTPNGYHCQIGQAVAKASKHCVMEKPISQNVKDTLKLLNSFKKSRGQLFPVLQVRYNPAIQTLRKYVNDRALGKIFSASVIIRWTRSQAYFDESDWKGSKKLDGGSLLTQAIHYIDVMQYLLGPAVSIFGKLSRNFLKIETEDTAHAIIDLKGKIRVNLEFSICTYPKNLECSLTVLGEKGTIKLGGLAMNEIEYWNVKNQPQPIIQVGLKPNVYANGLYVGSCPNHKDIYENLVNTLIYHKPSFIKDKDALESIKIIEAIKKSHEQKKEIKL